MAELVIDAVSANTEAVLEFVNDQIGECSPAIQSKVGIAVDEIFSNIARYAYYPAVGAAVVRVVVADGIEIEFEDSGQPYNPLTASDPDVTLPAEDRPIGGLGIFLVKSLMESVEYRREGDRNILTLRS